MKPPVLPAIAILLFTAILFAPAVAADGDEPVGYCRLATEQNLRSGPSTNYRVVKTVQPGALLEILEDRGSYYRVRVPDSFLCWVHSDYILYGEDMIGRISGSRVHLRSIPSAEGDYPLLKVDRGKELLVWEKKGEWVQVTAPAEAYAYVLKTAVTPQPLTADVTEELTRLNRKAREDWEAHVGSIRNLEEEKKAESELLSRFAALEAAAVIQFSGYDLDEMRSAYEAVASETADEPMKKLAQSRIREIDALIKNRKIEAELKERDAILAQEEEARRREAEEAARKAGEGEKEAAAPAVPSAVPDPGIVLTVLGRVDASSKTIVLRGGRSKNAALYTVVCPDRRYALKDFHDRRIAIRGSVERIVPGELPRIRIDRIEVLR